MSDDVPHSYAHDIALLLDDAALVHEAEGRAALARHHRRAARRLDESEPS